MGTFAYRGPLTADSKLFRGCQKELDDLLRLCSGAESGYAIIYGGRQTGKTSLLYRLSSELIKWPSPIASCYVNYQGTLLDTTPQTIQYLALCISRTFPDLQLLTNINTLAEMESFLLLVMEQIAPKRLILMLEELGQLPIACRRDLANMIRAIFTNRTQHSYKFLDQLVFVLAGSLELHTLVVAPANEVSPLNNICKEIYLSDLSQSEAISLISDGLTISDFPLVNAQEIGEAIYEQVAGHPYLVQRLGGMLEENWIKEHQLSMSDLDQALDELRVNDTYLLHLHNKVRQLNLESATQMLLDKEVRFTRHDEEMVQLELIGLAARSKEGKTWAARNLLFKHEMRNWMGVSTKWSSDKVASVNLEASTHVKTALVRIYAHAGPPIGVGFFVGDRKVLTCAHVVAASLGTSDHQSHAPSGEICVDWPLIAPEQKLRAHVINWYPSYSDGSGDIAILDLFDTPPTDANPARLVNADNVWGHKFRVFGFPAGHDLGVWTTGELRAHNAAGWLQIDATSISGYTVQAGFSGGPVWDEELEGVIGMVVASESASEVKAAFIIPSTLLREVLLNSLGG